MFDAGAAGAMLMIVGGIETAIVSANALRKGRAAPLDKIEAQGASLQAAFSAPEQQALPGDMQALINQLDTPGGGGHGGQGAF